MKNNKLVTIYARKSRLKNDDTMEISRQIELLVGYAEANNMEYKIFPEEGSSEDWNRPKLQEMLSELKSGLYDGVLVTEQDRISRDSTDFGLFKRLCREEGLLFFTLNKTYNFSNDDDNFMTGITAEMDNHFMRVLKRKMLRGRVQALQNGIFFGIAPFGYNKRQDKRLTPHLEEAKVVKEIFHMYVNKKMNQQEIANQVNLMGVRTRESKPFTIRSVSLILSNVVYIGTVYYELKNREAINTKNAHEAVIGKRLFNEAQVIRSQNRVVPQQSKRGRYMLSRLIKCPKCDTTLSFCMKYISRNSKNELNKEERELYVSNCYASRSKVAKESNSQRCTNLGVKAFRIEDMVLKELSHHIIELEHEIEVLMEEGDGLFAEVQNQIIELNKRLGQLDEQRKRVQEGFVLGVFDAEEVKNKMSQLNEDKMKLELNRDKLLEIDSTSEVDRKKKHIELAQKVIYGELDVEEMNTALRVLIDKIYYYKERADNRVLHPFYLEIVYKE